MKQLLFDRLAEKDDKPQEVASWILMQGGKEQYLGWLMIKFQKNYFVLNVTSNPRESLIYMAISLAGPTLPWISHFGDWKILKECMKHYAIDKPQITCLNLPPVFEEFMICVHSNNADEMIDYSFWSKKFLSFALEKEDQLKGYIKL